MISLGKGGPMTVATDRRMTLKDFLTYDDGTDMRYELEDGVLVEMGTESTGNTSIGMFWISIFLGMGIPYYRLATKHTIEVRGGYANARYPDLMVHSDESFAAINGRPEACVELTDPSPCWLLRLFHQVLNLPRITSEIISGSPVNMPIAGFLRYGLWTPIDRGSWLERWPMMPTSLLLSKGKSRSSPPHFQT